MTDDLFSRVTALLDAEFPSLERLYRELHAHPEPSGREAWTSGKLASELEAAGSTVAREIGGHGIVAILANGPGPVAMVRADMDGIPVKEETGLPYRSEVRTEDSRGVVVPVMHACGHDFHMTALVGVARVAAALRDRWSGTLMLVGQPSEEDISGAARMMADGLYSRFGTPAGALSFHIAPDLEKGVIGYRDGIFTAGSDSLDIEIRGIGGHAAHPDKTVDPVVIAARIVLAFQTIVSRECPPDEFAVITVASVHGGFKHNAIPDSVDIQVNIRYYSEQIRDLLVNAIRRTAEGIALSAGVPRSLMPRISLIPESVLPLVNDPALTAKVAGAFARSFGESRVRKIKPMTGSEDFGIFGVSDPPVPVCYFRVGCGDPARTCGFLHSSRFSPDPAIVRDAAAALFIGAAEVLDRLD